MKVQLTAGREIGTAVPWSDIPHPGPVCIYRLGCPSLCFAGNQFNIKLMKATRDNQRQLLVIHSKINIQVYFE